MLTRLTSLTAPGIEPVSLDEVMRFCRIDDEDESGLLEGMIQSAREQVELFTSRALVSQQFLLTAPDWQALYRSDDRLGELLPVGTNTLAANLMLAWFPSMKRTDWNVIFFDRSPLLSIDSVQYYDGNEALQTLASSNYYPLGIHAPVDGALNPEPNPGALALKSTASWPDVFDRPDAVQISFTAGYGTLPQHVPQNLRQAVFFMVKHLYDNRDAFVIGSGSVLELPFGIKHMLESRRSGGWVS